MTVRIDADVLIPGRGEPIDHGSVVFDGPTISYVGATASAPAGDGDPVEVPAVLPGLWECHAHFFGLQTPDVHESLRVPVSRMAARATRD
ncbi:MAG: amidohydrolase family protein, partial [Acidimicrobiia bacterium]|nr:amidohydrolase family protein [Acidimicrobiia bacterium]